VAAKRSKADPRLKRAGVSGFNKPKRTPSHPTKSHVVVAKEGSQVKTIRFGQQGVTGDRQPTKRQKSFKARHAKNIAKGKMCAKAAGRKYPNLVDNAAVMRKGK